jgi:hypothetical protein
MEGEMSTLGAKKSAVVVKCALDIAYGLGVAFVVLIIVYVAGGLLLFPSKVRAYALVTLAVQRHPEGYIVSDSPLTSTVRGYTGTGALVFVGAPTGYTLLLWAFFLVPVLAWLFILLQLRAVSATVVDEQPFEQANVHRLRVIGFVMLALQAVHLVSGYISWLLVRGAAGMMGGFASPFFLPTIQFLLAALSVFVLAEVFRLATHIREEQELTV